MGIVWARVVQAEPEPCSSEFTTNSPARSFALGPADRAHRHVLCFIAISRARPRWRQRASLGWQRGTTHDAPVAAGRRCGLSVRGIGTLSPARSRTSTTSTGCSASAGRRGGRHVSQSLRHRTHRQKPSLDPAPSHVAFSPPTLARSGAAASAAPNQLPFSLSWASERDRCA